MFGFHLVIKGDKLVEVSPGRWYLQGCPRGMHATFEFPQKDPPVQGLFHVPLFIT